MTMELTTYIVTLQDYVKANSAKQALSFTMDRIRSEETIAAVECMKTGVIDHYEIQTGKLIDSKETR